MPREIDFAVAWDWTYDREFVALLRSACDERGMRMSAFGASDAPEAAAAVRTGELRIGAFLDRAAPDEEPFAALSAAMLASGAWYFNHPAAVRRAADKATMHLEFLSHGIEVPYTIIISPYNRERQVELSLTHLARLGRPFIIKPANTTGGGTGVITGAETLKDVLESRQHHRDDKYLLQEKVVPVDLGGRRAWFRVFFVLGSVFPCWWDDRTHVYGEVAPGEAEAYALAPLETITREISAVCGLDFFSTEIALDLHGRYVTVDYVNEICDMRLQSQHPDGVPDGLAQTIAGLLTGAPRRARIKN
ncbi:MAG TPA: hypothetical protein VL221_00160 [Bacteroidota bacterium]|nr:hypothetical protein [Bacteroidota bacterium]